MWHATGKDHGQPAVITAYECRRRGVDVKDNNILHLTAQVRTTAFLRRCHLATPKLHGGKNLPTDSTRIIRGPTVERGIALTVHPANIAAAHLHTFTDSRERKDLPQAVPTEQRSMQSAESCAAHHLDLGHSQTVCKARGNQAS